uniref:GTP-binding protein n=1 Tax=Parastrongyloides trichosuri TaxID=131310 RepID=A0A0N4ZS45_PARTI
MDKPNFFHHQYFNPSSIDKHCNEIRPCIFIHGPKGSGKSSIRKVVFEKMSPNETIMLPTTVINSRDCIDNSFINLELFEFPDGNIFEDLGDDITLKNDFKRCEAFIYIIDAQGDVDEALKLLSQEILEAYNINNEIYFEIFMHKIDGINEEVRMDIKRKIFQYIQDWMAEEEIDDIKINYHMTSIFDHSIFEAFSKIVQKLLRKIGSFESFLDMFNQGTNIEKSFIFDLTSKVYIATDSAPVDMATYELCCDMIDVAIDVSTIYGKNKDGITFNEYSAAQFTLKTKQVLFMRPINKYLALLAIARTENCENESTINFNLKEFRNCVYDVFEIAKRKFSKKFEGKVTC